MTGGSDEIGQALARAAVIDLPAGAQRRFQAYLDLLLRWNARINLTSIRTPQEIIQRHFVECAFSAQKLPAGIGTLLDFGSGGGFPGIPIAICRPEVHVTLAESQSKKAAFLMEALRSLDLPGEVYAGRVEAMPKAENFDAVTMRAVDKMEQAVGGAKVRAKSFLALMATVPAVMELQSQAAEFTWRAPIQLPNTAHSILVIGERRGTVAQS